MNIKTQTKKKTLVKRKHYQIANAAIPLFQEKGFHQTSIREIADAAGISVGLLYKYISSKDDILFLAYRELIDPNLDALKKLSLQKSKNPMEKLRASMDILIKRVDEDPKKYLFLYTESKFLNRAALREVLSREFVSIEHFRRIIDEGNRKRFFACKDPYFAATIIVFLLMLGPMRGWTYHDRCSRRMARKKIIDFCLEALLNHYSLPGDDGKGLPLINPKRQSNRRNKNPRFCQTETCK